VLCPGFVRTNFHTSAGFNQEELKNMGIVRWMKPEKVVEISIKNLRKRNKVIVVPGFWNKTVKLIYTILPSGLYYRLATKYLQ
jgi:short-subunit dehydrogenase